MASQSTYLACAGLGSIPSRERGIEEEREEDTACWAGHEKEKERGGSKGGEGGKDEEKEVMEEGPREVSSKD